MHTPVMVPEKSKHFIDLEERYNAHNYESLPVVLTKGSGVHVWDVDGKKYYDFLSAYSAVTRAIATQKLLKH